MKTIYKLTGSLLMLLSLNTFASSLDLKISMEHPKRMVANTPLVWGSAQEAAPVELRFVKAKYAKIPLDPFIWGSPEDKLEMSSFINLNVPVAPFVLGNPDKEVPGTLKITE